MKLEDKTYCSVPESSKGITIESKDVRAVVKYVTGSGWVQSSKDMKQGAFACA